MLLRILKFTPLLLIVFLITGCVSLSGSGRVSGETENLFLDNKQEFNTFAQYFFSQKEVKNIRLDIRNEDNCKIINKWGICPREDEYWRKFTGEIVNGVYQKEYLNSLDEVLNAENISKNNYDKITSFMLRFDFDNVSTDDERKMLDIGDFSSYLRYYKDENVDFQEDEEYLYVKKIDDHWYVYVRDWN